MKLVNRTGMLMKKFGLDKAVDMLIDTGFDAIDLSFPDDCYKEMPKEKSFIQSSESELKIGEFTSVKHMLLPLQALKMWLEVRICLKILFQQ